jgi:putative Mg2+ transporter-C (MgtC) family protein
LIIKGKAEKMFETGNVTLDCLIRIAFSVICGIVLGYERKTRQQPVGMRTLILICVSCSLMGYVSMFQAQIPGMVKGDPTRIAAGVISGIGFLGGGAIMRQGMNIKGLTSAAIIWTTAALGLAIGAGLYIVAMITLVICLVSLLWLEKVEGRLFPAEHVKVLRLVFEGPKVKVNLIKKIMAECGLILRDSNMSRSMKTGHIILQFSVRAPSEIDTIDLSEKLVAAGKMLKFTFSD